MRHFYGDYSLRTEDALRFAPKWMVEEYINKPRQKRIGRWHRRRNGHTNERENQRRLRQLRRDG